MDCLMLHYQHSLQFFYSFSLLKSLEVPEEPSMLLGVVIVEVELDSKPESSEGNTKYKVAVCDAATNSWTDEGSTAKVIQATEDVLED